MKKEILIEKIKIFKEAEALRIKAAHDLQNYINYDWRSNFSELEKAKSILAEMIIKEHLK